MSLLRRLGVKVREHGDGFGLWLALVLAVIESTELIQRRAALDALTRARMQEELLQLWEDTRFTVLFVTHSLAEAVFLSGVGMATVSVLGALDAEAEEAAGLLGASRWQTFRRVTFPALLPGLLTGFALAFARVFRCATDDIFTLEGKP